MELLYEPQELKAWQLNNSFNEIDNCEIVRPSWKWNKTYWDTFFIEKRKSISESSKNIPAWDIVDSMTIDDIEYLLIHTANNQIVAYDDSVNFTGFEYTAAIGDETPIRLVKWKSGMWDITRYVSIEDAYLDMHDAWIWNVWNSYLVDDIVSETWTQYKCLQDHTSALENQPYGNPDFWVLYNSDESGYQEWDPSTITYNDVYVWSYLKVKLKKTAIRDVAIAWNYITFSDTDSNLQWVTTEIHYTETEYVDRLWNNQVLPNDEVYVYIRGTNLSGTRPYIGENVRVVDEVWLVPIAATETKVVSYNLEKNLWVITWAKNIDLYECSDWDEIVDLVEYDWVIFILTKNKILFSQVLPSWNINFYPLDFIDEVSLLEKLVPFWKMLVCFWENNAVISKVKVISAAWAEEFVYAYTDLIYNSNLYSKYSVISAMWSLYVLQDDKQFLQVDIMSDNWVDYVVSTENVITNVRGLFDFVIWEVYMNQWDRYVYLLDTWAHWTYYYKYNLEYKHWHTWDYLNSFYLIEDNLYWDWLFDFWEEFFDNVDDYRTQVVWFDFGWENLHTLKEVVVVKLIFGLNEKIVDYELEVQYQLGWILHTIVVDLKNYPINLEIGSWDAWLGDSQLNTTLLGNWVATETKTIGNFISVTVWLGITASVFNFRIKSKDNWFIYWGSTIGYINKIPTVTEYNYKH